MTTILHNNVGTLYEFSPSPHLQCCKMVFFGLLVDKIRKSPTLIWGEGGVRDLGQVSQQLLAEIIGATEQCNVFEKVRYTFYVSSDESPFVSILLNLTHPSEVYFYF